MVVSADKEGGFFEFQDFVEFCIRAKVKLPRQDLKFQNKIAFLPKLRQYATAVPRDQLQLNLSRGNCFLIYICSNLLIFSLIQVLIQENR